MSTLTDLKARHLECPDDRLNMIDAIAEIERLERERSNLGMLVRRMSRVMSLNGMEDRDVWQKAQKYLTNIGMTGSILRDGDIQEQSNHES